MSTPLNMTGLADNVSSISDLYVGANTITGNTLGVSILVGIGMVFFLAFLQRTNDTNRAIAAATWLTFIVGSLFWVMGFVSGYVVWVTLILAALSVAFTWRYR